MGGDSYIYSGKSLQVSADGLKFKKNSITCVLTIGYTLWIKGQVSPFMLCSMCLICLTCDVFCESCAMWHSHFTLQHVQIMLNVRDFGPRMNDLGCY